MLAKLNERLSVKTFATAWVIWLLTDLVRAGTEVPEYLWWAFGVAWVSLFGAKALKVYREFRAGTLGAPPDRAPNEIKQYNIK